MGVRKFLGCGPCACFQAPAQPSRFAAASSWKQMPKPVLHPRDGATIESPFLVKPSGELQAQDSIVSGAPAGSGSLTFKVAAIVVLASVRLRREALLHQFVPDKPGTFRRQNARSFEDPPLAEDDEEAKVRQIRRSLEEDRALAHLTDSVKTCGDEALCRRLLRKHGGNLRKSTAKFKRALLWREEHEELLTTRKFAQAGDNRVLGLDLGGHPVLYTCMKNQTLPGTRGVDQLVVRTVEAIDLMPPGVEKATHIWDLHGIKMHLNLSPTPLVRMAESSEDYFAERLHRLIVIDMSHAGIMLKDAVWHFVPGQTKEKILFLSAGDAKVYFHEVLAPDLAERVCSAMDQNRDDSVTYEERRKSWMQVTRDGTFMPAFDD